MDVSNVKALAALNAAFYAEQAGSFSRTRQRPWDGWGRAVGSEPPRSVLDAACGNMRFRRFLCERFPHAQVAYYGLDSCAALARRGGEGETLQRGAGQPLQDDGGAFQELDIVSTLLDGDFVASIQAPACDLVALFGFMHHVPTFDLRLRLARELLLKAAPGGRLVMTFWRFAVSPAYVRKACEMTREALRLPACSGLELGENDYLLGWEGRSGAVRYCHSFDDEEINRLLHALEPIARLVDRYDADGRTGMENTYLVLQGVTV